MATEPAQAPSGDNHLQAIEQRILTQVAPEDADVLERILISGKQILYNEKTRDQIMTNLRDVDVDDESDPRRVAIAVAGVLTMINRQADKIPVEMMVPAGALLGVEMIRFLNDAEMLPSSPPFTGNMIEELLALLMQKLGMSQPGMQQPESQQSESQQPQGQPPGGIINQQGAPV